MHLNTNLTSFRFLLGNPIPFTPLGTLTGFIPFPLSRGRGISYIREASPPFGPPFKERGKRFQRGALPRSNLHPPSLKQIIREGGQGDRFLNGDREVN